MRGGGSGGGCSSHSAGPWPTPGPGPSVWTFPCSSLPWLSRVQPPNTSPPHGGLQSLQLGPGWGAHSFLCRQLQGTANRGRLPLSWRLPSLTTFLLRSFAPSSHSGPHRFRRKWHSRSPLTGTNRPPALRVHCLCNSAGVALVLGLSSAQLTAHTEPGLGTEENATEEAQKQLPRSRRNEFGARGHLSLDVKLGYNSLALSSDLEERIT